MPQPAFDAALADQTRKPSTAGIIAQAEAEKHPERTPPVPQDDLRLAFDAISLAARRSAAYICR